MHQASPLDSVSQTGPMVYFVLARYYGTERSAHLDEAAQLERSSFLEALTLAYEVLSSPPHREEYDRRSKIFCFLVRTFC